MKKKLTIFARPAFRTGMAMLSLAFAASCHKDDHNQDPMPQPARNDYQQVNLVSDRPGFNAAVIDTNLVNAWGISSSPAGTIWVSSAFKGLSTLYRGGDTVLAPVTIPLAGPGLPPFPGIGVVTGQVFNDDSTNFIFQVDKITAKSRFIFVTITGSVAAWAAGPTAVTVVDNSATAVYTGVTIAKDAGAAYLYAANSLSGKIDVFDKNFHAVTSKPFLDPQMPTGFTPFNIKLINDMLFVAYAKPIPGGAEKLVGSGYVDIFKTDGTLVKRFASKDSLNAPWGLALANATFSGGKETILVGNFGDGRINMYDLNGGFLGQLKSGQQPLEVDGLWALEANMPKQDPNRIYFAAGPEKETHGLFGYLVRKP
ncbi:TIGR03118 family protein [Chitinophaga agrisoli]|nr:TIGR03118 family protein [Chitinophaga agrisoli]